MIKEDDSNEFRTFETYNIQHTTDHGLRIHHTDPDLLTLRGNSVLSTYVVRTATN